MQRLESLGKRFSRCRRVKKIPCAPLERDNGFYQRLHVRLPSSGAFGADVELINRLVKTDFSVMKTRTEKNRILPFAVCLLLFALLGSACRQDMHDQPKYEIYEKSNFDSFKKDESASRPIPANTVARGHLNDDTLLYTGKLDQTGSQSQSQGTSEFSGFADTFPFEVKAEDLKRGGERFNIYCSVCHDRTGSGQGMVVKRGYKQPPSFHSDRLRGAPAGYLFDVISRGFGAMPDYAAQIQARDRWLIVAYIRALQLSQNTKQDELTPDEKNKIQSGETGSADTKAGKGEAHQ